MNPTWLLVLWLHTVYPPGISGIINPNEGKQTISPISMSPGKCGDFIPAGYAGFCFTISEGQLIVEQPK